MWQPGVIQNKLKENHTYLVAMNYWTPLNDDNDNKQIKTAEQINMINLAQPKTKHKGKILQVAKEAKNKQTNAPEF